MLLNNAASLSVKVIVVVSGMRKLLILLMFILYYVIQKIKSAYRSDRGRGFVRDDGDGGAKYGEK